MATLMIQCRVGFPEDGDGCRCVYIRRHGEYRQTSFALFSKVCQVFHEIVHLFGICAPPNAAVLGH